MLVVARSGRALAVAARRAGYAPLVADFHGDDDARAVAARLVRLPARPSAGALLDALAGLAEGASPVGLAYGSLFEARPDLLDAVAAVHPVLGNGAAAVRRVKDPYAFAALCRECAVPHPAVAARPGEGEWLEKRAGGAGGGHVRVARPGRRVRLPRYAQRWVGGEPVSALFLGDGRGRVLVLGFSAQWASPASGEPFRYGGAVQPATLDALLAAEMAAAVGRVAAAVGLVGLNGADFVVRAEGFDLLEINPRAGASLDVFDMGERALFGLHVEACRGVLPAAAPRFPEASASAVAYARRTVAVPAGFAWPGWAADRQPAGRPARAGEPFCTVLARAGNAVAARALAVERAETILRMAEEA